VKRNSEQKSFLLDALANSLYKFKNTDYVFRGVLTVNDSIQRIIASRKGLFWDKGSLDPEEDKFVIVERILELGTERESQAVVSCYGDEFVREVVRNSRNLSPKMVNYFARLLDISREATRCFSDVSPRIWQPF
jgi:hypothetical protein